MSLDHHHHHHHHHEHHHPAHHGKFTAGEAHQARRLAVVLALVSVFFIFEFIGAILANSVVLRADAIHLLMDVMVLAMSLAAMRLAVRRPTERFTFGLRRIEPVAAIFNAMLVLAATAEIVREGIEHIGENSSPRAPIMLVVAIGALIVNGISAWLLHGAIHHGHEHENENGSGRGSGKRHGHGLSLTGVWLHLLGDALGSVAALAAAIVIRAGGPALVDPIASFLVAAILVLGAARLIREASFVLLEAAPVHLPVGAIRQIIASFPGVRHVHRLHVWSLGAGHDALTVHIHVSNEDPKIGMLLAATLRHKFGIEYVTVQIENIAPSDIDC